MKRTISMFALLVCLSPIQAHARGKAYGFCQQGNVTVTVPGGSAASPFRYQQSLPASTVTVYNAGTVTLASIYSDDAGTVKANPFTCPSSSTPNGVWFFYADNGAYDVRASGTGVTTPFTLGAIAVIDPLTTQPAINVVSKGADPSGVANSMVAFVAAVAQACAATPPYAVVVPQGTYLLTNTGGPMVLCDQLHIYGLGMPTINFTGTGALFSLFSTKQVELDHMQIYGTFASNTWAIRHVSTAGTAQNDHYHHMIIANFGDVAGTTGAGISIESDTQSAELGPKLFMYNLRADVFISGPVDAFDLHDSNLSTPPAHTSGPTRAVDASGGTGAGAAVIRNNFITTEGLGAFRINTGIWKIIDNDHETLQAVTNTNSAAVEILAGNVEIRGNNINTHNGANYSVFFAAGVAGSSESHGIYSGFASKAVKVNSSASNVYGPSVADTGPSNLYSADNAGIILPSTAGGVNAQFFGYSTAPSGGFPAYQFGRNGPSIDGPTNYITGESGANNAIAISSPAPLAQGLRLTIALAHTLQIGANTFNYNGGGALSIVSSRNPANNISVAYAAAGYITLIYDGVSKWLDLGQ